MQNFTNMLGAKIPVISLVLSAIVAWLLLPISGWAPMVPFFILFTSLSTLVYLMRKDRSWFDAALYVGILSLSCFLLLRANAVIQFIDFIFIIVFGSLLIIPITYRHTLINLLTTPFLALGDTLTGKNMFPYSWDFLKKYNKTDSVKTNLPTIIITSIVTLLFLGISIPLLSSANPFFNQLTQNILKFFDLTQFARYFSSDQILFYAIRLMILAFLAYAIPRALTISAEGVKINEYKLSLPINYLIPKIAMSILLIVFFVTQAQLYFATPDVLQRMGYTNSRLTNEVFFQVTIVAFIIFFLTFLDKSRESWNKRLTYFLIFEAFFLVGIAFKSVFDYSFSWGLTQKRLWGYATMTWLSGALLIFTYYYARQIPILRFFRLIITLTILVLLGINTANFDYLISHYSKARTQSGTDYVYLARLSPDSSYYKETLTNLVEQSVNSSIYEHEKINASYNILSKIDDLKLKYKENKELNSFNVSEYQEYLSVRNINTEAYRKKLSDQVEKYNRKQNSNPQPQTTDIIYK